MSTNRDIINSVTDWLNNKVLPNVMGKQEADNANGYILKSPIAYSMFIPNRDMVEDKSSGLYPCVLVQLNEATDYLKEHTGNVSILLHILVWNPGTHITETQNENTAMSGMKFNRNADGWNDAMLIADFIEEQLILAGNINGSRVIFENGIKIYPYKEQNAIMDFYPMFYMDMEFTIEKAYVTTPKSYNQYL